MKRRAVAGMLWTVLAGSLAACSGGASVAGIGDASSESGHDGAKSADARPVDATGDRATKRMPEGGLDVTVGGGVDAPAEATKDSAVKADASAPGDAMRETGQAGETGPACTTRVTYGATWIHGGNHPAQFDVAPGNVTWDGTCTTDSGSSYAVLSNGWKPYFMGPDACILALDHAASCGPAPACATRVTYGSAWSPPAGHATSYDDIGGRVFGDGVCHDQGTGSYADLSNGWQPHFTGNGACGLSFRYTECGGLYTNPVIPFDCPDPGVLVDGNRYVLTCTSGGAANAFPIFTSPDLATWTAAGHIFPSAMKPTWANGDFWAPEIHKVGGHYVAYFSARDTDGMLSVGVASASSPLGPFTAMAQPLVHDAAMGHIDASEINAPDGTPYALWKDDGNAIGKPTPIHAQQLAADGLSLVGSPSTLITNDQAWEGNVTEGPFMVVHGGEFFLFYSGNNYGNATYAVGVARASSPLGPFTKASGPIVVTGGAWAGPGHCSVVDTPAGDTYMVLHAWESTAIGQSPGRLVLTEALSWGATWPSVPLAPSKTTRPLP